MSTPPTPQFPLLVPPRPKPSKRRLWIVACLAIAFSLAVVWMLGKSAYHNYRLSSAAVDRFHQQLDQGDFENIYGDATDNFRRAGTREATLKFFENVHQKMGISGKRSVKGFHVNWQNGVLTVDEVFDTEFTLGEAKEGFIWVIDHDQPRLQTYHVDAANLR